MAVRNIVKIDAEKCNGCGQCVSACAEGAIQMIDGKARLVSDTYCDGLGACLGECPMDAITIEQRESDPFDEAKAAEFVEKLKKSESPAPVRTGGCPGSAARSMQKTSSCGCMEDSAVATTSELTNWPVQLKLVPVTAPYLKGADLLLTADCVPFALADFHKRFLVGKPVLIGCPKLDDSGFYVEKLTEIIKTAQLNSITVIRMEVPCCSGLSKIAEMAIKLSGMDVQLKDVIVGINGEVQ